jgi:hypothetical protein
MFDKERKYGLRTQVFLYEGSGYSLSEIVLLAFSLDCAPPADGDDGGEKSLSFNKSLFRSLPKLVGDDDVDLLVSLLWSIDSISSQAYLNGARPAPDLSRLPPLRNCLGETWSRGSDIPS